MVYNGSRSGSENIEGSSWYSIYYGCGNMDGFYFWCWDFYSFKDWSRSSKKRGSQWSCRCRISFESCCISSTKSSVVPQ